MAKYKVILSGVADTSPGGMEGFLARFAEAYKTTPDKASELIRKKQGVIYTLEDEAKAGQAREFLEKMGGLVKVETEQSEPPPLASPDGPPPIDDGDIMPSSPPPGPVSLGPAPPPSAWTPPAPPPGVSTEYGSSAAAAPAPRPRPKITVKAPPEPKSFPAPPKTPNYLLFAGIGLGALVIIAALIFTAVKFGPGLLRRGGSVADAIEWPEGAGYQKNPGKLPSSPHNLTPADLKVEILEVDGEKLKVKLADGTTAPEKWVAPGAEITVRANTQPLISLPDYNGDPCELPPGITVRVDKYGQFIPVAYTKMPLRPAKKKKKEDEVPNLRAVAPVCGRPLNLWSDDDAANRRNFDVMENRKLALLPHDGGDSPVYYTLKKYPLKGEELNKFVLSFSCNMSFMYSAGELDRDTIRRNIKRFESISVEEAKEWKDAFDKLFGHSPTEPIVAWSLVAADPLFDDNDFYEASRATRHLKRLGQLTKDEVDRWVQRLPIFKDDKYSAALTIITIEYFYKKDQFNHQAFNDVITGKVSGGQDYPLHTAARKGDLAALGQLIPQTENINALDDLGYAPIHYATMYGQMGAFKLLGEKGADINAFSENGNTPLMYAVLKKHRDIAEQLIAQKADLNARNGEHETALMYAAYTGDKNLVNSLITNGANIYMKNKRGQSAVGYARAQNFESIATSLIAMSPVKDKLVGRWIADFKHWIFKMNFSEKGNVTVSFQAVYSDAYNAHISGTYKVVDVDEIMLSFKGESWGEEIDFKENTLIQVHENQLFFFEDPTNKRRPTMIYKRMEN